ncbi:MAG: ZIP family zinc transporter [Janthinobacterium sp.]|jgi:ZIP family zinc transporter
MTSQYEALSPSNLTWHASLYAHVNQHRATAAGLAIALLGLLLLLAQNISNLIGGNVGPQVAWASMAGGAGFAATALGAMLALLLKGMPQKIEDSMLGFAAGMMLAASAFSLIIPGIAAGTDLFQSRFLGSGIVIVGLALGTLLMLGLDQFTPHEHTSTGPCGPGYELCQRGWLFVFAIALHNLPEGMAMGVSFAQGDMAVGLPLSAAIAIQDIPEGLAVALALRGSGMKPIHAVLIAAASGLLEPIGALLGVGLSGGMAFAYPLGLGLAAGAMLFVVSHEVIPETHRNGHQTPATLGLMGGFALMLLLDTALG